MQRELNAHIMPLIERDVEMIYDDEAERSFAEATNCFICCKPLDREHNVISRDHFTGRFRGAVDQECNFQYKIEKERYKLPIFFQKYCAATTRT